MTPYLDASPAERSVFECPSQPWGSYVAQGAHEPTTTYAYNGYYLSPAKTPGWAFDIAHRPWRTLADIRRPTDLLVFADALLGVSDPPRSTALLDPPMLFNNGAWKPNAYPTTAFRHAHAAVIAHADASVSVAPPDHLSQPDLGIDSLEFDHYVPDWRDWTK